MRERKEFKGNITSVILDAVLMIIGIIIFGGIAVTFAALVGPEVDLYSEDLGEIFGWLVALVFAGIVGMYVAKVIKGVPRVEVESNQLLIYKGTILIEDVDIRKATFDYQMTTRRGVPLVFLLIIDDENGQRAQDLTVLGKKQFKELAELLNEKKSSENRVEA